MLHFLGVYVGRPARVQFCNMLASLARVLSLSRVARGIRSVRLTNYDDK